MWKAAVGLAFAFAVLVGVRDLCFDWKHDCLVTTHAKDATTYCVHDCVVAFVERTSDSGVDAARVHRLISMTATDYIVYGANVSDVSREMPSRLRVRFVTHCRDAAIVIFNAQNEVLKRKICLATYDDRQFQFSQQQSKHCVRGV